MTPPAETFPAEELRAEVERIATSQEFLHAARLVRFLRYIVDQSIEGHADAIKEYSIGVEVFDRGSAFDPRSDSVVRVEARRLRAKLEEYYVAHGAVGGIVISMPKGSYLPVILKAPSPDIVRRLPRLRLKHVAAIILLFGAGWLTAHFVTIARRAPSGSVVVLPLENLSASPANSNFCHSVADQVASRLAKVPGLTVITRGPAGPYEAKADLRELVRTHAVRYALEGSAAFENGHVRITMMLVELKGFSNIWTETYDIDSAALLTSQSDLALGIAARVRDRLR